MIIRLRLIYVIGCAVLGAAILAPLQWLLVSTRAAPPSAIASFYCRFLCHLIGLRITRMSPGSLPQGPALLAPNHVSWTDILVLASCGATSFLAKKEVANWPVVGLLARLHGVVFVDRERRRSIIPANRSMTEVLEKGGTVVLFPEGTTNDGLRLKPFKSSHFEAGKSFLNSRGPDGSLGVTAIALDYGYRHALPASRAERARMAWYGETGLLPHLQDLLRLGHFECRISIMPEIRFDRTMDRKEMARRTGELIRAELIRIQNANPARPPSKG